jgi:hypothetical protein
MKRQKEMEDAMTMTHNQFMTGLNKSLDILDRQIDEAAEMMAVCTDEWCLATENYIDELHKYVYSISEPRWLSEAESAKIRQLRNRIRDLYVKFRQARPAT